MLDLCICPCCWNQGAAVVRQHKDQMQDSVSVCLAEDLQIFPVQRMVGANDCDPRGYLDVGSVA